MEGKSDSSTRPSVVKDFSVYSPRHRQKSLGPPDEGAKMFATVLKRKEASQQLLAMQNHLARLAKDQERAQQAIRDAQIRSDYILQKRRMKQEALEMKRMHQASLLAQEQANRVMIKKHNEAHRSRLNSITAEFRGRNHSIAVNQRKLSQVSKQLHNSSMEAELRKKAQRRMNLSSTLESFREGQRKSYENLESSLKMSFNKRLMTEQQLIEEMNKRLSDLDLMEKSLIEKLSHTQMSQRLEAKKLEQLELNRDVTSRAQLNSVLESHPIA
jgi:hypothetical protein